MNNVEHLYWNSEKVAVTKNLMPLTSRKLSYYISSSIHFPTPLADCSYLLFWNPSLPSPSSFSLDGFASFTEKIEAIRRELPQAAINTSTHLPSSVLMYPSFPPISVNELSVKTQLLHSALDPIPFHLLRSVLPATLSSFFCPNFPLSVASFQTTYKQAVIFSIKKYLKKNPSSCLKKILILSPLLAPDSFLSFIVKPLYWLFSLFPITFLLFSLESILIRLIFPPLYQYCLVKVTKSLLCWVLWSIMVLILLDSSIIPSSLQSLLHTVPGSHCSLISSTSLASLLVSTAGSLFPSPPNVGRSWDPIFKALLSFIYIHSFGDLSCMTLNIIYTLKTPKYTSSAWTSPLFVLSTWNLHSDV